MTEAVEIAVGFYPFVDHADEKHIRKDLDTVEKVMVFLESRLSKNFAFGYDNIMDTGIYREMGWAYDFRPYLRRYVFKTQHGLFELYALNKSNLRTIASFYGYGSRFRYIQEIPR